MHCLGDKHYIINTISDLLDDYTKSGEVNFGKLSDGVNGSIAIFTKLNEYLDFIPMSKRHILSSALEWFIENHIEEYDFFLDDNLDFVDERSRLFEFLKNRLQIGWAVMVTGNMTLAIVDGKRIVARVDMLSQNTLKAGTDGERLCRAMNDLTAIANAINGIKATLPYESGLSPLPWSISQSERRFAIYDNTGRTLCSRNIAVKNKNQIVADFAAIEAVIQSICDNEEI